ncbi:MAG: dimethylsulfonioproprionate lyase family protein [Minwuia sp.]|nr:dimethylsulfonioproprionate lyase family protein [Minwuia sp.]
MNERVPELQAFIDAAGAAFAARAGQGRSQASVSECFGALARPGRMGSGAGARLPVCDRCLETAVGQDRFRDDDDLLRLAIAFRRIEPALVWGRRSVRGLKAEETFADGHANAMVLGPDGIERRTDVWLGVSLLAPHVRYPDHDHPPEETYLVMSAGEFMQDGGPWFQPGIGGSLYNPPGSLHAMRAGAEPLFAFWLLRSGPVRTG